MTAAFLSLISLLFVAAITPGPNNFIILALSINKGWRASLLPIAAILAGTQLVLLVTTLGLSTLLNEMSELRIVFLLFGCLYLLVAGCKMVINHPPSALPSATDPSFLGLFFFQIINPKSWILVGTAYTAFLPLGETLLNPPPDWYLNILVLLITCPCLLCWATFGRFIKDRVDPRYSKHYILPALGITLIISSAGLLSLA